MSSLHLVLIMNILIVFQPQSQGGRCDRDGFQGNKRKMLHFFYYLLCFCYHGLTCFLVQVSVTSSSGILSATLVESGWAGEGPGSGCRRGREGGEDPCLKVILSTQRVENNKDTAITLVYLYIIYI